MVSTRQKPPRPHRRACGAPLQTSARAYIRLPPSRLTCQAWVAGNVTWSSPLGGRDTLPGYHPSLSCARCAASPGSPLALRWRHGGRQLVTAQPASRSAIGTRSASVRAPRPFGPLCWCHALMLVSVLFGRRLAVDKRQEKRCRLASQRLIPRDHARMDRHGTRDRRHLGPSAAQSGPVRCRRAAARLGGGNRRQHRSASVGPSACRGGLD